MCTLQNHVEKVCTLVSLNHVYFKFVYSIMAPLIFNIEYLNFRAKNRNPIPFIFNIKYLNFSAKNWNQQV